jgi:hypothetical protein
MDVDDDVLEPSETPRSVDIMPSAGPPTPEAMTPSL